MGKKNVITETLNRAKNRFCNDMKSTWEFVKTEPKEAAISLVEGAVLGAVIGVATVGTVETVKAIKEAVED